MDKAFKIVEDVVGMLASVAWQAAVAAGGVWVLLYIVQHLPK